MTQEHTAQLRMTLPDGMSVHAALGLLDQAISSQLQPTLLPQGVELRVIRPAPGPHETPPAIDLLIGALERADALALEGDAMLSGAECVQVLRVMQAVLAALAPPEALLPDSIFESLCDLLNQAEQAELRDRDQLLTADDCCALLRRHAPAALNAGQPMGNQA